MLGTKKKAGEGGLGKPWGRGGGKKKGEKGKKKKKRKKKRGGKKKKGGGGGGGEPLGKGGREKETHVRPEFLCSGQANAGGLPDAFHSALGGHPSL